MKNLKRGLALVMAVVLVVTTAITFIPPVESRAATAQTVTVDTSKTKQYIRGFGGINLPDWVGSDMTEAQRKKAFGNGADELGLSVLRVYISDDPNAWSRSVETAKYAQSMGATLFATPWNPPSAIREEGNGTFNGGMYHLPQSKYQAYVNHLNSFYDYMKGQGVNIYSISVQNEPDYSKEWTGWTSDETTYFLANYADQIKCKVMSPESFQYTNKDYYTKILNNSKAFANTDLFGTHFYGTQRSQMNFPDLENCGKEIWMTEVYVPNSEADSANRWPEAIQVAQNIHNGLVEGNMSAYVWWYIRRSYGLMTEDGKISKRGYCMAQYSKWVRPGYVRIEATEQPTDGVYVSAYKGDNKVVIVAVNSGAEGYAQNFQLAGQKIKNVDRYRTSSSENLAETKNLATSENSFYAQLPSESVSTFVITLDDGSSTPTVDVTAANMQDGWYYVKNVGTQKYLQVANNTGADGANVEVGTGTGVAGQKWYLTNKSDGYVTLKNALGYMLDIQYGEKNDGTNIQIYSDNGADAQRFKIVKTSASNVYGITTKITSDAKALKVDGTNVCQYAYDAGTQQQWVLEPTSYTEPGTSTDATLLNTYGKVFGYSGTCINVSELKNAEMLAFLKKHYNSITLENEMKPDAILRAWSKQLITVEEAKALGYYIPSNYTDKYVPKLNFDTVDEALKICYENGLKMRAHTLVWHSQTPTFFFRKDYDASGSYVSSSVMDARMEFYIRTVMNHVYDSKYGKDVVYAWDVVNEYLNARTTSSSDWVKVYGEQGTSAAFVKKAFTIASDVLSKYDLKGKVSLFYNDFNTYMNANDVVSLINYVNGSGKVCDGIGMQSHLGTDFPSPSYYKEALTKFKNAGFEIQITELDVANLNGLDQPQYYYDIAAAILATKKSGGNITGFTLWGMWDSLSWITKMEGKEHTTPLLFTGIDKPKDDYYKVIKAYTDAGYTIGGSGSGGSTGGTTVDDTGYTRVDLSTATAGSYNSSDKKLTLSDALSTRINLPTTVKAGQTAKVIINVTYNGSSGFRAWLTNASESNLSEQFRSSEADLSGDVVITFTATQDSEYLLFKGPDYQTNIDNLTVNYVKVKVDTTSSVTLDKSYSEYNGNLVNNPLVTNKYLADPTCIVYNGRVYVYGTAERFEFDENGTPTENKFKTSSLSVISSSDLVNWTDEGEIDVKAITGGWAGNSWAPSITSKVINGKTYFFLYFANGGNGIGVLRSTSPLGPWEDPLGKALITRNTDNCSNVLWLFDPAAFVDDDGTGYLAFGGGVPDGQQANPKTGRIVKLGSDMISLDGTPQLIDAPYLFEDSELNKINGKYVYSYCKNWNTPDGTSATIAYMTSDNPMSGYTYKGVIVKNPGTYFGLTSNNHHHMFEFNGSWYILYHTLYLEKAMYGTSVGYRSLNIDKVNIANDGTISSTMTYAGVNATQALNPYSVNNATTMAWNGGIKTAYDSQKSAMVIDDAKTGNWIGISNVAFGTKGSDKVTFNVSTTSTCTIDVYLDAPTVAKGGKKVGYALISANSADYRDVTATLTEKITGTHDLYFVFAGPGVDVATWKFTEANAGSSQQAVTHTHNFTEAGSTSSFYAITGNTSTSKGSVTYNGLSLKTCLKMESTTNIAFTAPKAGKLTLVFGGDTNAAGKSVKVNGTSKTIGSDGVITLDLAAGSHTITKGDSVNLFYISYATEGESHTHSYTASVTKEATCGATGVKTYTCTCGDSYTEIIPATGAHSYTASVTKEATCTEAGVKTYTCNCGDSYTEAIAATGHSYSNEWTIDKEATTTSAGEKSRHCTNCSARTDITVIPKVEVKNGLVLENGNYYYYVDGAVATDYTGLVYSGSIWWYVENGVLNTGYTGTFTNNGGTWYIINGQLDSNYVGIRKNGSEFWYVVNGKVNTAFVGLYNYADAWWYITDGKIQTSYSGIVDYSGYKWFVSGGKVDITYTGIKKDNLGTFYCVQAGKVNLDYTGLVQNAGAWWYIVDGVLDTGMTGIIESGGSQWLVATGKLQSGYTGNYMYKNVTYVITNGKVVGTK